MNRMNQPGRRLNFLFFFERPVDSTRTSSNTKGADQHQMSIEQGKRAPAFTLRDQDEHKIRLADLRGDWVVLYFYPKDDTPGCTVEACEFTAYATSFRKMNAKVFGISPDSPERHRKFIAKYNLDITLLSDPDKSLMAKYGAYGEKMLYGKKRLGVIRSTVIIDPKGKAVHHYRKVRAKGHADKVKQRLADLQAAS